MPAARATPRSRPSRSADQKPGTARKTSSGRWGRLLDQGDEVGVAEIRAPHARGKGPTHRLRVERVEVGIVDRTGPQERPRGRGRPRQDLAVLEERHGRAFRLGPGLALAQGEEAGVVDLEGESSHQGTRRLWSRRSSR